jgi:hypothetical protein
MDEDFNLANFGEIEYRDNRNSKQPMYYMTRDGFMTVAPTNKKVFKIQQDQQIRSSGYQRNGSFRWIFWTAEFFAIDPEREIR